MTKAELKKKLNLDFTREDDELFISGTIDDFKIFGTLPIKIENAGKGYAFKSKSGKKYKVKIINTEKKQSILFALQAIDAKYRVNNMCYDFNIPVIDIINQYRKTWLKEATKEHYHKCERCGGTGIMPYSYANGVCFRCDGSGIDPKLLKI